MSTPVTPRLTLQPLSSPTCANCRFFANDPDHAQQAVNLKAPPQGICVRYPPQSQIVATQQGAMTFMVKSIVPAAHWCGEHKPSLTP